MLGAPLVLAAFVAGVAGTWSPCGMSMICTLSPEDSEHGRLAAFFAALALAIGCVAGGVALFVGLAIAGRALLPGGDGPVVVASALAGVAALLDATGIRVRPQIRAQVPESWRRRVALPLASCGYGLLLGLGFTTFVMSYTLWGAALLSLLVGTPALGVAVGIAFGAGRALPIVVLAPWADVPWACDVQEGMSQRPAIFRAVRILGACLIAVGALGAAGSPALAAGPPRVVASGTDPSVDGSTLAFRKSGGGAASVFTRDLGTPGAVGMPGQLLAVGGGLRAQLDGPSISIAHAGAAQPPLVLPAPPGVDALAISDQWLAYRVAADPAAGRNFDQIIVRHVDGSDSPRTIAGIAPPSQLGPPALSHERLAYHVSSPSRSRISVVDLATGTLSTIQRPGAVVLFPAVAGTAIAFVEVTSCYQRLLLEDGGVIRVLARRSTLVRRDDGYGPGATRVGRSPDQCQGPRSTPAGQSMFWQTALTDHAAYLTIIDALTPRHQPSILELPL